MSAGTDLSFGRSVTSVGVVLILAALIIVGWQVASWFGYGHWLPISLRTAMAYAGITEPVVFGWRNVQKIWDIFAAGPLSLYVFLLGGCIAVIGEHKTEEARQRVGQEQSKQRWTQP
jgi:hypothetical protein